MNNLIEQALRYEQEDNFNKAEQCYMNALANYPNDKEVLCSVGIFFLKKSDYEKALDFFVQAYSHTDQDEETKENLLNLILITFYQPNEEMLKKTYNNNYNALMAYEHNFILDFVNFEDLFYLCIPKNDLEYYILDKRTKRFMGLLVLNKTMTTFPVSIHNCVVAVNIFDFVKLQNLTEQTNNPEWINEMKVPVYVIWLDNDKIQQYLQVVDYSTIIDLQRVVFFSYINEESHFYSFFRDHQSIFPDKIVGDNQYFEEIISAFKKIGAIRDEEIAQNVIEINKLAKSYNKKYYQKLFSSSYDNIRILFYTCRFSTVIQYANRDFMQACQALGIQCEVLIEKSDIHRVPEDTTLVQKIAEFKPNIIFFIHYFKSDFKVIPRNIMSISWLQDPNYKFDSVEHAQQFRWNDFALALTPTWYEQMIQTGYAKSRLIVQPVPVADNVFHSKHIMSLEDRDFYTSDISFPANYQRPEKNLSDLIIKYTGEMADIYKKSKMIEVLISTYDVLRSNIDNSELIYRIEQCEDVINELTVLLDIVIESETVKRIANDFFYPLCYNLQREITLKWLIDNHFQVKLWGLGWKTDSDFKNNAMGVLKHGTELAKMYSCTKIVLGATSLYTSHFRSWESISCGALFMARYIPPEFDNLNIRETFTEDKQFVFYYNKQDLIDKVKYYLANENERQRIVENGRQIVLKEMTYSSAVHKCLSLIKRNVVK